MEVRSTCISLVAVLVVMSACMKKQDDMQPPMTAATAYVGYPQPYPTATGNPPPAGYSQAPASPYAQPGATAVTPQYPPQGSTAPNPAVAPPSPPPATSGTMATPGPLALPCQNDLTCGTHHCNTQYGKCAFPCQSAVDCLSPNQCMAGLCVPSLPQAR